MLKIYNTLSGKKEVFEPLVPGHVGMYVCGVTVYDLCHIGHARSALVFDVIRTYLEYKGFKVTYIRNFTDIDDKIIARAQKEGLNWEDVARNYIKEYYSDMELLGVRNADIEPKATEHIEEMKDIIGGLMENGHAYSTDGDVYYRVKSFVGYGKLSKRNTEDMLAGARVEIDERKADPLDFALWKSSKPGEPEWKSPWGGGRPGWHIECSAMSMKYLGVPFDIHGGGKDLIFPHHENEIAQSEAFSGKAFARYWIHNGFVNVNQEKMSKSLGNFFTIREVIEKYPHSAGVAAEILRYFILSNHYRSPVDFSDQAMDSAHAALDGFYDMLRKLNEAKPVKGAGSEVNGVFNEAMSECEQEFIEAMDDDINTAAAIGALQKLRKKVNSNIEKGISPDVVNKLETLFKRFGNILGLFSYDPAEWGFLKTVTLDATFNIEYSSEDIGSLVSQRDQARKNKNWKRSDEIRTELEKAGIILEDRPDGTTRIKR